MGIQQMMFGGGARVNTQGWAGVTFDETSNSGIPVLAVVTLTVSSNGEIVIYRAGDNGGAGGTNTFYNWYLPTTTGIGANYWVRATVAILEGTGPTTGSAATGTWISCGAAPEWRAETGAIFGGNRAQYELTLDFSATSDGSNIVSTGMCVLWAENLI